MRHSPDSCPLHKHIRSQAPFPPPALPGITGTTSLSATPYGPAWPSRASGWWLSTTAGASRVASDLLVCVPPPLPRRDRWVLSLPASPATAAFPVRKPGRLPHYPFRGLLSVYSRFSPHTRRVAWRPSTPEASEMSLPTSPLRLLPTVATSVGWDSHPLKFRAFSRRTSESRLNGHPGAWGACQTTRVHCLTASITAS